MSFDAKAFDRAQRRKVLSGVGGATVPKKVKPKPKQKPKVERKPQNRKPRKPGVRKVRKTPLTPEELVALKSKAGKANARSEALKDQECEAILNILLKLKEKHGTSHRI